MIWVDERSEDLYGYKLHDARPDERWSVTPYLTGAEDKGPRDWFFYFSDDSDVLGIRWKNFKILFMEQRCPGTMMVWAEPFVKLRMPKIFNLRTDPFERADIT